MIRLEWKKKETLHGFDTLMALKDFVGAVDSILSCAVFLHVPKSIDRALTAKWADMKERQSWE